MKDPKVPQTELCTIVNIVVSLPAKKMPNYLFVIYLLFYYYLLLFQLFNLFNDNFSHTRTLKNNYAIRCGFNNVNFTSLTFALNLSAKLMLNIIGWQPKN